MPAKGRTLQNLSEISALEKLVDVGQSLVVVRDLKPLLRKIAKTARSMLAADIVVVYEYQEESGDVSVPPITSGEMWYPQVVQERGSVRPHEDSAVFKMLQRTQPFYAPNARKDWAKVIKPWSHQEGQKGNFVYREGIVSSAAVPLVADGQRVGVLFVNYRTLHDFQDAERKTIELFAMQAAIAIHNADLFAQERQRFADMKVLQKVTATISRELDIKKSLVHIAKGAVELTRTKATSVIHLFDEAGETISDSYEFPTGFGLSSTRFAEKKGLTWDLFRTGEIVEITSVSTSKRVSRKLLRSKVESVIGVPLKINDRVIGALFLNSFKSHDFTDEDKTILSMLAEQAVIVIQNARRYQYEQTLRRQADTLRKVSSAVGSKLELKQVANRILEELGQVIEYRKASIQLVRGDRRALLAGCGLGNKPLTDWLTRPISQDRLISRVVSTKKPLILSDTSRDGDWETLPQTKNVKSWVGLPLTYRGKVIGLLTLDHDRPGYYTPSLEGVLVSFGNQAAVAIQSALLYERRVRDQSIFTRIVRTMNTKLNAQEAAQAIVSAIAYELECTHCSMFLAQKEGNELLLIPFVTDGPRSEQIKTRRFTLGEGLAGWVFQHRKSVVLDDARDDPRFAAARDQQDKPRSMLIAPVKVGDQVIGVISADQDEYAWFGESDRRLVDALAQQAGIAIQRSSGLDLLQQIGRQIISIADEDEILQQIINGAIKLTHTSRGVIYLVGDDGLSIIKEYRYPPGFDLPAPRLDRRQGLTYRIIANPRVIAIPDIERDQRVNRELVELGVRSLIGVPLTLEDKVIGVLYLNDDDRHAFTETERSLLSTLASQAAIAIKNARLFQQVQQRAEALKLLQEVSGSITSTLNIDETLPLILKGAMRLTGASSGIVRSLDESGQVIERSFELPDDFKHPAPRLSNPNSMTRRTIDGRQPIVVSDVGQDDRVHPGVVAKRVRSMISLPLKLKERVVGILGLNGDRLNQFEENQSLLLTLADQAAVAIENSRLFAELERHATQLVQLQKATASVLAESNAPDSMLESITTSIASVFRSFSCTIRPYDPEAGQFEAPVASRGAEKRHTLLPPRPDGTSQYVLQTKQPVYGQNVSATLPNGQPVIRPENHVVGVEAVAYLPLLFGEELVGRLAVSWDKPRYFSENDKRVLGLFAGQAAATIKIASLYRQLEEKNQQLDYLLHRKIRDLKAVYQVSQRLTSDIRLSEQDVLALIHEQTKPLMDTDNMYMALYDEVTNIVRFPLMFVDGEPTQVSSRSSGKGRTEWIIQNRKPIFIETRAESEKWYGDYGIEYIGEPFASWIGVPLMAGDRVLGVIATYHKTRDHVYTQDDLEVLSLMANQVAIVLQNARTWEAMQKLSEDLSAGALLDVA